MEWETTPLEDARRFKDNIFFIFFFCGLKMEKTRKRLQL